MGRDLTAKHRRLRPILIKQARDSGQGCAICGKPFDWQTYDQHDRGPMTPECDHIVPFTRTNGHEEMRSYQVVHAVCNQRKGDRIGRRSGADRTQPRPSTTTTLIQW